MKAKNYVYIEMKELIVKSFKWKPGIYESGSFELKYWEIKIKYFFISM